jgi:hypothetical protein
VSASEHRRRTNLRVVAAPEGGVSNSRPSLKIETAGFDTVRLRFRSQEKAYTTAKAMGAAMHARGELRHTVAGVTVGAYPDGLVTVEGRLAALLHGEDDHRLLDGAAFERAPEAAAAFAGLDLDAAPVGVGRADLASERVFADPREGRELLRAASYVDVPWLKVGTEGRKREVLETVYWRTVRGRSIVLRLYDKGVETGQHGPGTWLRLERQRRWRKEREPTVADVLAQELGTVYAGRELRALVEAGGDVVLCTRDGAVAELRRLHARGELRGQELERLVGFVYLGGEGLARATFHRRAGALRRRRIALHPEGDELVRVPGGAALAEFAAAWAA